MEGKQWSFKYTLLVSICVAFSFFITLTTAASATRYYVNPGESIQAAVNNASEGDTIVVRDGTYTENIDVNKRLNIQSENGSASTAVQASNTRNRVFAVTADYVNICGFTVEGAYDSCGIHISDVNNCTISNNVVFNNSEGIYLSNSSRNIIANNTAKENGNNGIYLVDSNNNRVTDNDASNNVNNGIFLESSNNNEIRNNVANSNHDEGIELWVSRENIIANNTAKSNGNNGIYLSESKNNKLTGNIMVENGIIIRGDSLSQFLHEIDESNTVNGKPVYYWKDVERGKVPEGAGQVILVNCSNVIVENQNLNDASDGIEVAFSIHSSIKGNNCTYNNGAGIYIHYSKNNSITGNNCSYNKEGIKLYSSSNYSTLVNNTVSSNNDHGIYVSTSNFNIIAENTIADNDDWAICLCYESNYNRIENNTISNNAGGVSIGCYDPSSHNIVSDNVITGTIKLGAISIYKKASNNNTILHNTVLNNTIEGIHLDNTRYNIVKNNTALNNRHGIYLKQSTKNIIENNTALNNYGGGGCGGITLDSSNSNTVDNNIVSNNYYNGIYLSSSINNTVGNNIASNNSYGIYLSSSRNNTIKNNSANSNDRTGIFLFESSTNNRITSNNASSNNRAGITLGSLCNNNTLKNNEASFNEYFGMILFASDYNDITGNYASSNNGAGISLGSLCSNNTLKNNEASFNKYFGVMLVSNKYNTITNNDLFSNLYGLFLTDLRCFNNITNNNASNNNLFGIYVDNSHSQAISYNTANSNERGIGLRESSEIKMINNVANSNRISGFSLINSTNNTLFNNSACFNTNEGIYLSNSSLNYISYNNVSSKYFGILLYSSDSNTILNNIAESNYYFKVFLHPAKGNNTIEDNAWYIQTDIVRGVRLYVLEAITPYLQTVEDTTNATYQIVVENLGNSPDTFDLSISSVDNPEISNLDKYSLYLGAGEISANTTSTEVELPQTNLTIAKINVETITLNVSDTEPGFYRVKVVAHSRNDNTVKGVIETWTIVQGMVDSELINSTKINKSAIIKSSIDNSIINRSAIINSTISDSIITDSLINNSEVVRTVGTNLSEVTLEDAIVNNGIISRGNITLKGITYEIENETLISDLVIGTDYSDSNLVGIKNAKTLKVPAEKSNVSFDIYAKDDYFAGSMQVQKSMIPPDGIPEFANNVGGYVYANASDNLVNSTGWLRIKVYYDPNELDDLNASALRLRYFSENADAPGWEDIDISGINLTGNYVWGNISHYSVFALHAQPSMAAQSRHGAALSTRGGGVGVTRPLPEEIAIPIANQGTNIFNFEWLGLDITKILIDLKSTTINAKVTLKKTAKPVEIPDLPGIVYGYFDIATNLKHENIRSSNVNFRVIKSWTVINDVNVETIKLCRYANGWQELETAKIKEDDKYCYFTAETNGVSLFAITGGKRAVEVTPTAPIPTSPIESPPASPPAMPPAPGPEITGFIIIVAIVASAIIVLVTYWVLRRIKA